MISTNLQVKKVAKILHTVVNAFWIQNIEDLANISGRCFFREMDCWAKDLLDVTTQWSIVSFKK